MFLLTFRLWETMFCFINCMTFFKSFHKHTYNWRIKYSWETSIVFFTKTWFVFLLCFVYKRFLNGKTKFGEKLEHLFFPLENLFEETIDEVGDQWACPHSNPFSHDCTRSKLWPKIDGWLPSNHDYHPSILWQYFSSNQFVL